MKKLLVLMFAVTMFMFYGCNKQSTSTTSGAGYYGSSLTISDLFNHHCGGENVTLVKSPLPQQATQGRRYNGFLVSGGWNCFDHYQTEGFDCTPGGSSGIDFDKVELVAPPNYIRNPYLAVVTYPEDISNVESFVISGKVVTIQQNENGTSANVADGVVSYTCKAGYQIPEPPAAPSEYEESSSSEGGFQINYDN